MYKPTALYSRKEDKRVINATYNAGDIVITTALGSRGTDWLVEATNGFHVVCTFEPHDTRTQLS